jgi:hypothetical protein
MSARASVETKSQRRWAASPHVPEGQHLQELLTLDVLVVQVVVDSREVEPAELGKRRVWDSLARMGQNPDQIKGAIDLFSESIRRLVTVL